MQSTKITHAFEQGNSAVGVFLDFSKAFDTTNHDILLAELHYCGIGVIANNWFKSYPFYRNQVVDFNGTLSSLTFQMQNRVPQGSILGLLLFLIM